MPISSAKAPSEAKSWAELCLLKQQQYESYLSSFSETPVYDQVVRPSGDPDDFPIWRELYFGKNYPDLCGIFRKRCVDDIRVMFAEQIFERCQGNKASIFPADRALAQCIRTWLLLFSDEVADTEQLRLAADDYFDWISRESCGGYDEIDEFRTIKAALLYYVVGDLKRAEMVVVRLQGKKIFHKNLISLARVIFKQAPLTEREVEDLLRKMLAVDYYWGVNQAMFAESDTNFLLLAAYACFQGGTTINSAAETAKELSSRLTQ